MTHYPTLAARSVGQYNFSLPLSYNTFSDLQLLYPRESGFMLTGLQ